MPGKGYMVFAHLCLMMLIGVEQFCSHLFSTLFSIFGLYTLLSRTTKFRTGSPGLLLSKGKRCLSCNIARPIVYDADLNTISQSTEIAL